MAQIRLRCFQLRAVPGNRPFFSRTTLRSPRRDPYHLSCVEIYDLASVSHSVRSVSNSVRQTVPPVSANLA
jgi:hypothetical protein